jgi:hypothetical protein
MKISPFGVASLLAAILLGSHATAATLPRLNLTRSAPSETYRNTS